MASPRAAQQRAPLALRCFAPFRGEIPGGVAKTGTQGHRPPPPTRLAQRPHLCPAYTETKASDVLRGTRAVSVLFRGRAGDRSTPMAPGSPLPPCRSGAGSRCCSHRGYFYPGSSALNHGYYKQTCLILSLEVFFMPVSFKYYQLGHEKLRFFSFFYFLFFL